MLASISILPSGEHRYMSMTFAYPPVTFVPIIPTRMRPCTPMECAPTQLADALLVKLSLEDDLRRCVPRLLPIMVIIADSDAVRGKPSMPTRCV